MNGMDIPRIEISPPITKPADYENTEYTILNFFKYEKIVTGFFLFANF